MLQGSNNNLSLVITDLFQYTVYWLFVVKKFCCFMSLPSFLKKFHGYQLLRTSFHSIHMQKSAKKLLQLWSNLWKMWNFSLRMISNIQYKWFQFGRINLLQVFTGTILLFLINGCQYFVRVLILMHDYMKIQLTGHHSLGWAPSWLSVY